MLVDPTAKFFEVRYTDFLLITFTELNACNKSMCRNFSPGILILHYKSCHILHSSVL